MARRDDKDDEKGKVGTPTAKKLNRRDFLRTTAVGAGALAVTAAGCASSSSTPEDASTAKTAHVPSSAAWKFGIMADTQWVNTGTPTVGDDGVNPDSCAVDIVSKLNQQFIAHGVKFVVQVGDLADRADTAANTRTEAAGGSYTFSNTEAEDTRALFTQALYAAGIGFFPLRGNHDADAGRTTATEFQRVFPQTQNGQQNGTPTDVFAIANADSDLQPSPVKTGTAFAIGSGFESPSDNLKGLSYAFDYNNARFVLLDQFPPADGLLADGTTPHTLGTAIQAQQTWIDGALAAKPAGGHAFVFAHKGLLTEDHVDVLFGSDASAASSPGLDPFIASLALSGVRLFFCGHDHMHDRSHVATMDGSAKVTQIVGASDSNKFYYPANPSNDVKYCGGARQTLLAQERNTIGFYIVTVDGENVTVDFYSAPAYPSPVNGGQMGTTPTLNFGKRETFGYCLAGKEFVVAQGASFASVQDTSPAGTQAKILGGSNGCQNLDPTDRQFNAAVDTGWLAANGTASDILLLQGMAYTMGSDETDPYALSLSYEDGSATADQIAAGKLVLATPDDSGNWVKAVSLNSGGSTKFVAGPWKSSDALGTYGIDTVTNTVWAVVNFNGYFAAVLGV